MRKEEKIRIDESGFITGEFGMIRKWGKIHRFSATTAPHLAASVFVLTVVFMLPPTAKAVDSNKCNLVEPPKTSIELLENIKCAVAQNILFDDDIFKDDEKLWKLTSGQEFFKNYPMPNHIVLPHHPSFQSDGSSVGIGHFPVSIDKAPRKTISGLELLYIEISKTVYPTHWKNLKEQDHFRLTGGIGLQLDFDDVVKLFGPDWKRIEEITESSGNINSIPPYKPTGNMKRKLLPAYVIGYPLQVHREILEPAIVIHFDKDGYLQTLEITLTE